jgi:hypothetical protein
LEWKLKVSQRHAINDFIVVASDMMSGECSARMQIDAGCPPRTIWKKIMSGGRNFGI